MAFPGREECGFQLDWQIFKWAEPEGFFGGLQKHIQLHRGSNWGELKFAGPSQARAKALANEQVPKVELRPSASELGRKKVFPGPTKIIFFIFSNTKWTTQSTDSGCNLDIVKPEVWHFAWKFVISAFSLFPLRKSGPNHFLRHFLSWKLRSSHEGHNKNWSWPSLA